MDFVKMVARGVIVYKHTHALTMWTNMSQPPRTRFASSIAYNSGTITLHNVPIIRLLVYGTGNPLLQTTRDDFRLHAVL